jgi:hypothetical protein
VAQLFSLGHSTRNTQQNKNMPEDTEDNTAEIEQAALQASEYKAALKKARKRGKVCMWLGFGISLCGAVASIPIVIIVGVLVTLYGCMNYVEGKGYSGLVSGLLGMLGLLSLLGFAILACLPDVDKSFDQKMTELQKAKLTKKTEGKAKDVVTAVAVIVVIVVFYLMYRIMK